MQKYKIGSCTVRLGGIFYRPGSIVEIGDEIVSTYPKGTFILVDEGGEIPQVQLFSPAEPVSEEQIPPLVDEEEIPPAQPVSQVEPVDEEQIPLLVGEEEIPPAQPVSQVEPVDKKDIPPLVKSKNKRKSK